MTKNQKIGIISAVIIIILLVVGFAAYKNKQTQEMINDLATQVIKSSKTQSTNTPIPTQPKTQATTTPSNIAKDPQNATYTIEGEKVTLIDGKSADGNTTMFGEPAVGDLNGDGESDAGVILVVAGGSGTFYYSAAALNNTSTYTYDGTNGIFLGDRIAPQTKSIANQIYTVNFAERAEGEPMTSQPSVNVSKYFKVNGTTLTETNQ